MRFVPLVFLLRLLLVKALTLSLQFVETRSTNDEWKLHSSVGAASGAAVITFSAPRSPDVGPPSLVC